MHVYVLFGCLGVYLLRANSFAPQKMLNVAKCVNKNQGFILFFVNPDLRIRRDQSSKSFWSLSRWWAKRSVQKCLIKTQCLATPLGNLVNDVDTIIGSWHYLPCFYSFLKQFCLKKICGCFVQREGILSRTSFPDRINSDNDRYLFYRYTTIYSIALLALVA
jgi:hypothetical protein